MIKIQNNSSGLTWPDHDNFELKAGENQYESVPPPLLERFKEMHEAKQIVLDIEGFKYINGAFVAAENTPKTIEHAPTEASPDVSTTGPGGAAQGASPFANRGGSVAPPGKPTEKK